jgi:hypothetical protein
MVNAQATHGLLGYDANYDHSYSEEKCVETLQGDAFELYEAVTRFGSAYQGEEKRFYKYGAALTYCAIANQAEMLNVTYGCNVQLPDVSDNAIRIVQARLLMNALQGENYLDLNLRTLRNQNRELMQMAFDYLIDNELVINLADGTCVPDDTGDAFLIGLVIAHDLLREECNAQNTLLTYAESVDTYYPVEE